MKLQISDKLTLPLDAMELAPHDKCESDRGCAYVYLLFSNGLYKIGHSVDVKKRIRDLRNGSAAQVNRRVISRMCCQIRARQVERHLHAEYRHRRKHGEWFKLHDAEVYGVKRFLFSSSSDKRRRLRLIDHDRQWMARRDRFKTAAHSATSSAAS